MYYVCIILNLSLILGTSLRASVNKCLAHYLTHDVNSSLNERDRKSVLKDWLAPWGKGMLGGFPKCAVSSMLAQSAVSTT